MRNGFRHDEKDYWLNKDEVAYDLSGNAYYIYKSTSDEVCVNSNCDVVGVRLDGAEWVNKNLQGESIFSMPYNDLKMFYKIYCNHTDVATPNIIDGVRQLHRVSTEHKYSSHAPDQFIEMDIFVTLDNYGNTAKLIISGDKIIGVSLENKQYLPNT